MLLTMHDIGYLLVDITKPQDFTYIKNSSYVAVIRQDKKGLKLI